MAKNKNSRAGFTLMEIMIVIAIIGILATMIIGAFLASQKKGRDVRRKGDLAQLTKALDMYNSDQGSYPPAGVGGVIHGCGTLDTTVNPPLPSKDCLWGQAWTLIVNGNTVTYEIQLPSDTQSGRQYYYASDGTYYQLYASLENTDDMQIPTNPATKALQTYTGTICVGSVANSCNYGIASTNTLPESHGHDRIP